MRPLALLALFLFQAQWFASDASPNTEGDRTMVDKDWHAAWKVYEKLFLSTDELPENDKAILLKAHDPNFWENNFPDLQLDELVLFRTPRGDFCVDSSRVARLNELLDLTKDKYPTVHNYLEGVLKRQLRQMGPHR